MSKPVNVEVVIHDQNQVERMIKKFSRKVKKSGLLEELKDRRYFTKKSVKRRLKRLKRKRLAQEATKKYKEKFKD
jgi:ribosomal protein S21|tara:strand:+ start:656 stop:880 length:225 start_codon:yes stop_codon:yes gene_type:complete